MQCLIGSAITHSEQRSAATATARSQISVEVPPVERRWKYHVYQDKREVQDVLEEYEDLGELHYLVRFWNGIESEVRSLPFLRSYFHKGSCTRHYL